MCFHFHYHFPPPLPLSLPASFSLFPFSFSCFLQYFQLDLCVCECACVSTRFNCTASQSQSQHPQRAPLSCPQSPLLILPPPSFVSQKKSQQQMALKLYCYLPRCLCPESPQGVALTCDDDVSIASSLLFFSLSPTPLFASFRRHAV